MEFREFIQSSPNFDPVPHERLGVAFHHSERAFQDTIDLMLRPESKVSYHCLIGTDGSRCTLVPDERIAWHAGASSFHGRSRCNDFLLGMAFAGDTYSEPLTEFQLKSAIEWLGSRWNARGWTLDWMTDHRQIAPGRKKDLNPPEWLRLHGAIERHFSR